MPPRRRQRNEEAESRNENERGGQPDPMQQFINQLVGAFNRNPTDAPINPPAGHMASFKDFKSVGPPEFKGSTEPMEAQSWVKEVEKAFVIARVGEEQKTAFATYLLKGEANFWWEANQNRAGEGVVAWDRFKEVFFENYFPSSMRDRMEVQFLELKQGAMTVSIRCQV